MRDGELRRDPLRWTDRGDALTWGVQLTWDLPQLIFARDETQLVHAHVHLAKVRQQAAAEGARLFLDRREKKRALAHAAGPELRARLLLEVVRLTAELDARTGGLFRAALAQEEVDSAAAAEQAAAPRAAPPPTQSGAALAAPAQPPGFAPPPVRPPLPSPAPSLSTPIFRPAAPLPQEKP